MKSYEESKCQRDHFDFNEKQEFRSSIQVLPLVRTNLPTLMAKNPSKDPSSSIIRIQKANWHDTMSQADSLRWGLPVLNNMNSSSKEPITPQFFMSKSSSLINSQTISVSNSIEQSAQSGQDTRRNPRFMQS